LFDLRIYLSVSARAERPLGEALLKASYWIPLAEGDLLRALPGSSSCPRGGLAVCFVAAGAVAGSVLPGLSSCGARCSHGDLEGLSVDVGWF